MLKSLDAEVRARLLPGLTFMELRKGEILVQAGENPGEVFFPLPGTMISLVVVNDDGSGVEVGVIGYEGMVGMSAIMGESASPYQGITQIEGSGFRIKSDAVLREFDRSPSLRKRLLRYANFLTAQSAQTALCNRLHPVEERLARWLLICQDRVGTDTMSLTHELLSQMLGTRRSTVSLSASILQNAGLIRYLHGKVKVLDRRGLEGTSCTCYAALARQMKEFNGLDGHRTLVS
jgi:CRP-like cAMP-binding protein